MLPIAKELNVGMINWGFVDGKEQTKYLWDGWSKKHTKEPQPWHHVLFHAGHPPYDPKEIDLIESMININNTEK